MIRRTAPYVAWRKINYCFTQQTTFLKKTDLTGTGKNSANDRICQATNEK